MAVKCGEFLIPVRRLGQLRTLAGLIEDSLSLELRGKIEPNSLRKPLPQHAETLPFGHKTAANGKDHRTAIAAHQLVEDAPFQTPKALPVLRINDLVNAKACATLNQAVEIKKRQVHIVGK